MLIEFKDEDFENKIKKEDISVIQFSASWCSPCKALKPVRINYLMNTKIVQIFILLISKIGINTGSSWRFVAFLRSLF